MRNEPACQSALPERPSWRPGARVTILDVATGCEHLANGRTHVVCYSKAPEQLEIHLWIGESANPSCRTGHPVWIGGVGHAVCQSSRGNAAVRYCGSDSSVNECVPACHFHHRTPPRAPIDWLPLRQSIGQMARR